MNPTIRHPAIACAGALLFLAAGARAQTTDAPVRNDDTAPEWTATDTDRDGYLEKDELIGYPGVLRRFEEIDLDGDGRISENEYADWRHHPHPDG
jgi:hypothetical protein